MPGEKANFSCQVAYVTHLKNSFNGMECFFNKSCAVNTIFT